MSRSDRIGRKIRKIEHEGIRGKKVSHEQAVAVAHSMVRKQEKKHRKRKTRRKKK